MDNQNSLNSIKCRKVLNHFRLHYKPQKPVKEKQTYYSYLMGVKTAGQSRESDEAPGIMSKKFPALKSFYFCYFQVCCTCHQKKAADQ